MVRGSGRTFAIWKIFLEGEHDPHRLTVHGLSYLQKLDRERDS
jgi:hypothetical protein